MMTCTCGQRCQVMPTAYGQRAVCTTCNVRWTRINGKAVIHADHRKARPVTVIGRWTAERR